MVLSCLLLGGMPSRLVAQITAPVSVPLTNTPSHILIYATFGLDPVTHVPVAYPYVLDTGSFALATALGTTTANWQNSTYATTGGTFTLSYGTGTLVYTGNVGTSTVTLTDPSSAAVIAIPGATLGIITNQPYSTWNSDINATPPTPPEPAGTYGTLGAGLAKTSDANGSMNSVLGQILIDTSVMDQGYLIHSGGATATDAKITIGLTPSAIASIPELVAMRSSTGTFTANTGQSVKLYPENQLTGTITLVNSQGLKYSGTVQVVVDSGGLGPHLVTGGANNFTPPVAFLNPNNQDYLADGVSFTLSVSGTNGTAGLDWSFTTGSTPYVNQVNASTSYSTGVFNTGVTLFHNYDVMFDTTTGLIGFDPLNIELNSSTLVYQHSDLFQGKGSFTSALGTGINQIQWTGSGGFSAQGGDLTVNLGGHTTPDALTWGVTTNFVKDGDSLIFGSKTSDGTVHFENAIDLHGQTQTILVTKGIGTKPEAEISGNITDGSLTVGDATHNGTLELSGHNTYTGATTFAGGTVLLGAADAISASSPIFMAGGTFDLGGFSPETFTNALTVEGAGSTIDFGAGHSGAVVLQFADSSAVTWTSNLDLLNFTVGTDDLGFGSASGLTLSQLADIQLAGYEAVGLNSNGFVDFIVVPEPSQYGLYVVFAVTTAFGWRYLRRTIKPSAARERSMP